MLISLFVKANAQSNQESPFLYYYSEEDSAFIIERTDGTDRQVLARTHSQASPTGPGWSASGAWFV
jgi:hypothetical protein